MNFVCSLWFSLWAYFFTVSKASTAGASLFHLMKKLILRDSRGVRSKEWLMKWNALNVVLSGLHQALQRWESICPTVPIVSSGARRKGSVLPRLDEYWFRITWLWKPHKTPWSSAHYWKRLPPFNKLSRSIIRLFNLLLDKNRDNKRCTTQHIAKCTFSCEGEDIAASDQKRSHLRLDTSGTCVILHTIISDGVFDNLLRR